MGCTSDLIGDYDYCHKKQNKMSYTREQIQKIEKDLETLKNKYNENINDISNIKVSCSSVSNDIPDIILVEFWKSDILKKYEINGNNPVSFYLDWEKINEIHPFETWKEIFKLKNRYNEQKQ